MVRRDEDGEPLRPGDLRMWRKELYCPLGPITLVSFAPINERFGTSYWIVLAVDGQQYTLTEMGLAMWSVEIEE